MHAFYSHFYSETSNVATGGGRAPPLAGEVCKIARFCCFLGLFLVKNGKQPPPKEIGCQSREVDVVIRCEKAFVFPISAEKSASISVKTFFFFWTEKTSVFSILAEKLDSISVKTFFFGDHLFLG